MVEKTKKKIKVKKEYFCAKMASKNVMIIYSDNEINIQGVPKENLLRIFREYWMIFSKTAFEF